MRRYCQGCCEPCGRTCKPRKANRDAINEIVEHFDHEICDTCSTNCMPMLVSVPLTKLRHNKERKAASDSGNTHCRHLIMVCAFQRMWQQVKQTICYQSRAREGQAGIFEDAPHCRHVEEPKEGHTHKADNAHSKS